LAYNHCVEFEWDVAREKKNRTRHGLSFQEASELFTSGADYLEIFDEVHSQEEDRFIAIGPIRRGVVVVVFTEREEEITRIISARFATTVEAGFLRRYMGEPT